MTSTTYGALAADDSGGDGRPPIVLVHGLTFDRHIWQPITERLAKLDPARRVVAFDLPSHGGSPAQPSHEFEAIVGVLHDACTAAGIEHPVVVGHSISGGIVSLYAARHPVSAVVNVDQPLDITGFAGLVTSIADQIRGPAFAETWKMFHDSFHTDLLPEDMRALVETNSQPRQDLVLTYWATLLEGRVDEATAMIDQGMAAVAEQGTPYKLVVGSPLPPAMEQWITARLPQVQVLDWSPSGHFPHLAHPDRFAGLLAAEPPSS